MSSNRKNKNRETGGACCPRIRGRSPSSQAKNTGKKHRGPASCLFRGQDHGQRLLDEFDVLRNLKGKL